MTHINQKAKRTIIQVLCIILACAVVAGGIFGIVKLVEHFNSETKTLNLKFTQGALDSKGEYVETKGSLYTKEAFECQGLSISPAFDNNISYEVFFYDSTGEFLYSSGKQLKNYTFTSSGTDIQSMFVSHARIVITPDDDDEIKWNEKSGYVKQLKVEVKRDQKKSLDCVVITCEENLHFSVADNSYYIANNGDGSYTIEHEVAGLITYKIAVGDYHKVKFAHGDSLGKCSINIYFLTSDDKMTQMEIVAKDCTEGMEVDIPKNASYVLVCWNTSFGNLTAYLVK